MHTSLNRYRSHYRALLSLGLPIVVGQLGTIVLGFADTLMVGHHSMTELAAASFVNTIFALFVIFAMGFSYGLTPLIGNLYGRGETEGIGPVVRNGLLANTVLALVLMAVLAALLACLPLLGQPRELLPLMHSYMLVNILSLPFVCWLNTFKQFFDAIGRTRTPMCILLMGNVLNIIGNYMLIYGAWGMPEMGLLGAGLSTAFSRVVMALVAVGIFFCAKRYGQFSTGFRRARVCKATFRRVNAMSWPLGFQMGMESASFSLTAIMVGWLGATALAAHQVLLTISQVFYMVYYGLAAAVAVRVSYFHGQGDLVQAKANAAAGFHVILLIGALFSVPFLLLRGQIGGWFTDSAEVTLLVSQVILLMVVYQFGDGMQCCYSNALRGLGCVRPMMRIAFVAYFVVSLPLSYLFGIAAGWGLVGIWCAFPVSLLTAGVLYWHRFRKEIGQ